MSKWICKNCETLNDEEALQCEVCDSKLPRVYNFFCDCSDIQNLSLCKWETDEVDELYIQIGDGDKIHLTENEYNADIKKNTVIRFYLSNKIGNKVFEFPITINKPYIEFFKVVNNSIYSDQLVNLKWKVKNAESCYLNKKRISLSGQINEKPYDKFTIEAKNPAGVENKSILIKILPLPFVSLKLDRQKIKITDEKGVNLRWEIKNAKSAQLLVGTEAIDVDLKGKINLFPIESQTYILNVIGLDGSRIFTEIAHIDVYPEATFTFESDKEYVLPNKPFTLSWETKNAKKVELNGLAVSEEGSQTILNSLGKDITYTLSVTDEFETKSKTIRIKTLPIPSIKVSTPCNKFKQKEIIPIKIDWEVQNASNIVLLRNGESVEGEFKLKDSYETDIEVSSTFTIQALALDNETNFSESVFIDVIPEVTFTFETDKEYVFPTIPFTLTWKTQNAKEVKLNGKSVDLNDSQILTLGIEKDTKYILSVTDNFETKKKTITVKILPIPRIESLYVPIPEIERSISMNVDLKVPDIKLATAELELSKVGLIDESLYNIEIGLAEPPQIVDLNYKLKSPSLWKKIEKTIHKLLGRNDTRK
jgi:hypothetical protein